MAFQKAVKSKSKGRIAIDGPSGAGKTKTALRVARGLVGPEGQIALIDSEFGSASKYADEHDFSVHEMEGDKNPASYVAAIREAEKNGFDLCIIDSLTHAWEGTKDIVDKKKAADTRGNGFSAWGEGTKAWNALIDAIMGSRMHVIVTMRSKTDWSQEKDDKGKTVVVKLGMAPEIRDGTEFAFDVVLSMDTDHTGRIVKTRCSALDGFCEARPGEDLGATIGAWLGTGVRPERETLEEEAFAVSPEAEHEKLRGWLAGKPPLQKIRDLIAKQPKPTTTTEES
jgi:DNA polymerase III delta prime subunit